MQLAIKKSSSLHRFLTKAISQSLWLLVALTGTALVFRQLPLQGLDHVMWADAFDSKYIRWALEWGYHAIFETGSPLQVWNSNSSYPAPLALTYADSMLSAQLLYGPLRLAGASPGEALYLTLIGFCVIGCRLTSIALRRTGYFNLGERAFIIFSAHFSLGMTVFFYHYQLVGMQLAPPFLLFVLLYLRDQKHGDLTGALTCFFLGFCFSAYLGPMALTTGLLATLPLTGKVIRPSSRRVILQRLVAEAKSAKSITTVAITVAFLLPLFVIQVLPYLLAGKEEGALPYREIVVYSARPNSIFTEFSANSYIYGSHAEYAYGDWERAYFPGFLLLLATLVFLALRFVWCLRRSGPDDQTASGARYFEHVASHPAEPLVPSMLFIFFGAYLLSWGPHAPNIDWLKYPYYLLSNVIPGLREIRAPGRFGMLLGLPMGVFAIVMMRVATLSIAAKWKRQLLLGACLLILVVDSLPTYQISEYHIPHRAVYEAITHVVSPNTPLLELPIVAQDHLSTIHRAMDQLMGSTLHWARLVSGYGARSTPEYQQALHLDQLLMSGQDSIEDLLNFARLLKIEHLLVHTGSYPEQAESKWLHYLGSLPPNGIQLQRDDSYLVHLPAASVSSPSR